MQTTEHRREHEKKIRLLTKNVLFSVLNLPHSLEKRIHHLLQKIRTRSGKENLSRLDILYLALEHGLAQMEALEDMLIIDDPEMNGKSVPLIKSLHIVRQRPTIQNHKNADVNPLNTI